MKLLNALLLTTAMTTTNAIAAPEPILLWPAGAPGLLPNIGEEKDTTPPNPAKPDPNHISRIGNVTKPTITVYKPSPEKDTGAAVVVCPGGGYNILAYNLEGTEICDWLNSIGVTGVLLKYRVPGRPSEKYAGPLQDAQRAVSLVRSRAAEWKIDAKRVGILGFSAGGHLAAMTSNNFEKRTYDAADDADKESCRPDFTFLIYPAYLITPDKSKLSDEFKITDKTPPAFIAMTQDDPIHVENAYAYGLALKSAKVAAELHIYPKGGHGYGLRPSANLVSQWPQRAADWMAASGFLKTK